MAAADSRSPRSSSRRLSLRRPRARSVPVSGNPLRSHSGGGGLGSPAVGGNRSLLSYLFMTYSAHLGRSRGPRDLPELEWYLPRRRIGLARILTTAIETVRSRNPACGGTAATGVWPHFRTPPLADACVRLAPFPNGNSRLPGDTLSELSVVRSYLRAVGTCLRSIRNRAVMDDILVGGVQLPAQERSHSDGVIGPKTIARCG
jgi:hypothetical protein